MLQDVAAIRTTLDNARKEGKIPDNIVLNGLLTRDPHDRNRFWKAMVFLEQSWLRFLGIEAVLAIYGNDYQTTIDFSGRYRFQLLGLRLICFDLSVRRFPIAGLGLSFVYGGFSVKNVVPEDSEIMAACKTGDIVSVKELFRTRLASPNDVTPENSSPLRVGSSAQLLNFTVSMLMYVQYAIENGSKELVQVILASGADANAPFGRFMTYVKSPL